MSLRRSCIFVWAFGLTPLSGIDPQQGARKECAACHPKQARAHVQTLMAQTLERPETARLLPTTPRMEFKLGPYFYTLVREGDKSIYTVTDGKRSITAPILWAIGQGTMGQTYVYAYEGKVYESRASYFTRLKGLGVTIGAPAEPAKTLEEAAGREMDSRDVIACFNCHSGSNLVAEKDKVNRGTAEWTQTRNPGVQCESCHTGAERHMEARLKGDTAKHRLPNLKELTSEEVSDLCGRCHRTWSDIQLNGPKGVGNVRFQPYRLVFSKCYDAADSRISCIACHDSHDRPKKSTAEYDGACRACHQPAATAGRKIKLCKAGTRDCASCHMKMTEIPGSHYEFADHYIRVVKPNETYPD